MLVDYAVMGVIFDEMLLCDLCAQNVGNKENQMYIMFINQKIHAKQTIQKKVNKLEHIYTSLKQDCEAVTIVPIQLQLLPSRSKYSFECFAYCWEFCTFQFTFHVH